MLEHNTGDNSNNNPKDKKISPKFNFDDISPTDIQSEAKKLIDQGNEVDNKFPVDVMPNLFRDLVIECNRSLNFPNDYTGAALLSAVSTAIGKSAKLKVKEGWYAFANLYLMLVGNSGAFKSHPISLMFKALENIDKKAIDEFTIQYNEYVELENQNKKSKEVEKLTLPDKPILKKIILNDFTPEALVRRLGDNDRGCCIVSDELTTFFEGTKNYSKGNQESVYLSFYDNKRTTIDRVSNPIPLSVENPYLGVIGGIQPRMIQASFNKSKTNSGFFQRFLPAFPDNTEKPYINDNELPNGLMESFANWINNYIQSNPIDFDIETKQPKPKIYYFSPEAKKAFFQWQHNNTDKVNEVGGSLEGEVLTKFDTHCPRLILIIQIMIDYNSNQISLEAVKAAEKLCDYFQQCSLKVLDILENGNPDNALPENKSNFYNSLPENFTTGEANKIGDPLGFDIKATQRFLNNTNLFKKNAHGKYSKNVKS